MPTLTWCLLWVAQYAGFVCRLDGRRARLTGSDRVLAPARSILRVGVAFEPCQRASHPIQPRRRPPLISSLGALLRISLRRSRADWPIVRRRGPDLPLAATLLAAGVDLRRRGLDGRAPPSPGRRPDRPTAASRSRSRAPPDDVPAVDAGRDRSAPDDASLRPAARSSAGAIRLLRPAGPAGRRGADLAVLGYAEGLAATRRWSTAPGRPDGRVPPASRSRWRSPTAVAGSLGLHVGRRAGAREPRRPDVLDLDPDRRGSSAIDDPADALLVGRAPGPRRRGRRASGSRPTGRSLPHRGDLLGRATPTGSSSAGARSRTTALDVRDVAPAGRPRAGPEGPVGRRRSATAIGVSTGLPAILAGRGSLAPRQPGGRAAGDVQLVVLAAYAVLLSAAPCSSSGAASTPRCSDPAAPGRGGSSALTAIEARGPDGPDRDRRAVARGARRAAASSTWPGRWPTSGLRSIRGSAPTPTSPPARRRCSVSSPWCCRPCDRHAQSRQRSRAGGPARPRGPRPAPGDRHRAPRGGRRSGSGSSASTARR